MKFYASAVFRFGRITLLKSNVPKLWWNATQLRLLLVYSTFTFREFHIRYSCHNESRAAFCTQRRQKASDKKPAVCHTKLFLYSFKYEKRDRKSCKRKIFGSGINKSYRGLSRDTSTRSALLRNRSADWIIPTFQYLRRRTESFAFFHLKSSYGFAFSVFSWIINTSIDIGWIWIEWNLRD